MPFAVKISKPFKQAASFVQMKKDQLVQAYRRSRTIYVAKEAEKFGGLSKHVGLMTQTGGSYAAALVHIDKENFGYKPQPLMIFGKVVNHSSLSGRDNGVLGPGERYLVHNNSFYRIKLMSRKEKRLVKEEFNP